MRSGRKFTVGLREVGLAAGGSSTFYGTLSECKAYIARAISAINDTSNPEWRAMRLRNDGLGFTFHIHPMRGGMYDSGKCAAECPCASITIPSEQVAEVRNA